MAASQEKRTDTPRPGRPEVTVVDHETGVAAPRLWLIVVGHERFGSHPLPAAGEVVIGRGGGADVQIAEPSISRTHARLTLGGTLLIEDLSSANGTRVRGQKLEPGVAVEIQVGEAVELGHATVVVQRRAAQVRPRRLWPHGYFEGRVEDECVRAARDRAQFAVAVLHCERDTREPEIQEALAELLRPVDVAGVYGAGEYEVLLIEAAPAEADGIISALVGELARRDIRARAGLAGYPRDGRGADELIAKACAAARGKAGGEAAPASSIVRHPSMRQLHELLERIAPGSISVLLLGETGVGKEVLAEHVHRLSPRRDKPFLRLSCAALSETLLESELFGHERGAFTGATAAKPGLLETAEGGTVFLDEIGELPMTIQVKLLRVLEERKVLRVGSLKPRPIQVRFVAATNRDLESEVARGTFRRDLYYRLAGVTLAIPPLRDRAIEIEPLARAFIASACRQMDRPAEPVLSREALALLLEYSWPGNIRELRNVIERAVLLCSAGEILPEHLPTEKMRATFAAPAREAPPVPEDAGRGRLPEVWWWESNAKEKERARILVALREARGNQTTAAGLLGISRRTLLKRLDEHQVPRPRKRHGEG